MKRISRTERHALCDTLLKVGPEAPTLAGTWSARELAAHLLVRETRPDVLAAMAVRPLAPYADRVVRRTAEQDWAHLVAAVRTLPAWYSPTAVPALDHAVNLLELTIHHEDVRRAQPISYPRDLPAQQLEATWRLLRVAAPMFLRRARLAVELVSPGHGSVLVHGSRTGDGRVTLTGDPVELALYATGRRQVAEVVADGKPADVQRLVSADLAL